MLTLATGDTIQGVVDQAASATVTVNVMELVGTTESYKQSQAVLGAAPAVIYTSPASTMTMVRSIQIANTTSSPLTNLKLFSRGGLAANQLCSLPIPANGEATFDGTGWKVYDATGSVQMAIAAAPMPNNTVKGNVSGSSAVPGDLTQTQLTALINPATGSLSGALPAADKTKIDSLPASIVSGTRTLTAGAGLSGGGDLSADRTFDVNVDNSSLEIVADVVRNKADGTTNTHLAPMGNNTIKGNVSGGTAGPSDLTLAQMTAMLLAATQSNQGALSAADKIKLDKIWVDATAIGMSTANTGAQNVTAFNAWYATAPTFVTLFFPGDGFYDIASELTLGRDIRIRFLGAGKGRSILRSTSTTANIFRQTIAGYYISFEELGFTSSVTKTAGTAIRAESNNAYLDVRRCEFQAQFRGLELLSSAGNVGTISECLFTSPSPTAGGCQVKVNGAGINMMFQNITVNVTGVDTTGVEINECGAIQWSNCDLIGGRNTLLMNASGVLSAVYFNCVFFDQATFGSTIKLMGTFAMSRVKFVNCGIANGGGSGLVAVEIAGTGVGNNIPEAVDFLLCDVYNNSFAGTTIGFLITGVRGFDVRNSRIAGFTRGFDIFPYNGNGITNFNISGNTIGPTENFNGNATGININAGAFQYGPSNISSNDISGNTIAPIVNNGTYTSALQLTGNIGLANNAAPLIATPAAIGATETVVHSVPVPLGGLLVGTTYKIVAHGIMTATTPTLTARLRVGTAGTIADAAVVATPATAVATGTGWMVEMYMTVRTIGAGGTWMGNGVVHGTAPGKSIVTVAQAVNTTVANFLSLTLQGGGTTPVITVVNAFSEVPRQ